MLKLDFGADLIGVISIIASVWLGQYLAGTGIVLMLAGGEAIQRYAMRSASSVLAALANRMPSVAHRERASATEDAAQTAVAIGDMLAVYPHDICLVDGAVVSGHSAVEEFF